MRTYLICYMLAYRQAFVLMSPGWFQSTQLLDESSSWPTRQPSLRSAKQSAVCLWLVWSGQSCQGTQGLGVTVTSLEVILQRQREYTFHKSQGFLMQNWTGMGAMMEKALCLISPFPSFGRTVLNLWSSLFCFIASLLQSTSHQPG